LEFGGQVSHGMLRENGNENAADDLRLRKRQS